MWAEKRSLDRGHSLVGVAAVLLWVIGAVVGEAVAGSPPDDATGQQFVTYFENEEAGIYAGTLLFYLGSLLFIWWAARLRTVIAAIDPGSRLPSIMFGAAVATAVASMATLAPQISGAFAANDADAPLAPAAAQALWWAGDGFFVASAYLLALFMAAIGVAVVRLRVLPVWMGWIAFVIALALLIPFIGWAALIFAFPLWVIVASVLRWRAGDQPRRVDRLATTGDPSL